MEKKVSKRFSQSASFIFWFFQSSNKKFEPEFESSERSSRESSKNSLENIWENVSENVSENVLENVSENVVWGAKGAPQRGEASRDKMSEY